MDPFSRLIYEEKRERRRNSRRAAYGGAVITALAGPAASWLSGTWNSGSIPMSGTAAVLYLGIVLFIFKD
jgi:hypothetical protein